MHSLRHYALNVLLALASVSLTLFILEQGARWLQPRTPFFLNPGPSNCLQRSGLLSLEFRPNCVGNLAQTSLRTNSLGLRGPEIADKGTRRVLAIGDSCTWGWGVEEQESYPAILQQLLDQRAGAGAYQVINAGVPGYTSYQGLRYFRERGLSLRPAIVIASYGFNDLTRSGDVAVLIEQQARFTALLSLDDYLVVNSQMYQWLRWKLSKQQTDRGIQARRVAAPKYAIYMTQIADLAREHDAALLFIDFLKSGHPHKEYRSALLELERSGVPLIDYDGPRLDIVHPTAAGYRALAAEILDRLEQAGALPAAIPGMGK